jgi:excisionase family DNA binding protein
MTERMAFTIPEACASASVGRSALRDAISSGALRAVRRGRRVLVLRDDLREWLAGLPAVKREGGKERPGHLDPSTQPKSRSVIAP